MALPSSELARGASKFGGSPHVPVGFSWPRASDGRPLAFLAQLALEGLAARSALGLPSQGLLSFFYDAETQPWGSDPNHRGHAHVVLFAESSSSLKEASAPPDLTPRPPFRELLVHARETYRLPVPGSPAFLALGLAEATRDAYATAYWDLVAEESAANDQDADHVFGGYPVPIQSPLMEAQCALVIGGVPVEKIEDFVHRDLGELAPLLDRTEGYRLLLQLDTDPSVGWAWGDSGRLYFWMHQEDLRSGRFDAAWCVLQCG